MDEVPIGLTISHEEILKEQETPPYRAEVKIKNNRFWLAIKLAFPDVRNQSDAARRLGISPTEISKLLNMKKLPNCKNPRAFRMRQILSMLRVTEEWVFDPEFYGRGPIGAEFELPTPASKIEKHLLATGQYAASAEEEYIRAENKQKHGDLDDTICRALQSLSPEEEFILRKRFGITKETNFVGEKPMTLKEISRHFSFKSEHVRQIETKAMRKLRMSHRRKRLLPFLAGG